MITGEFRAIFFPYCLDRRPDGRYWVLNRAYLPLGVCRRELGCGDEYAVELGGLGAELATRLSVRGSPALDRIYLYDDRTVPTRSAHAMSLYLERLQLLAGLHVET